MKGKVSNTGYKKNSKDKNNDYNIIPTNRITMKNVDFPVLGISDKNDIRVMYPGEEHLFNGDFVTEYPMARNGVNQQDEKVEQQLKQLTNFSNNILKVGGNIKKSNIMKAEFLKIAKCKDEQSFYKKYPTEAAFFKAHPEAKKKIKKAQFGVNYTDANGNGVPDFMEGISAAQNIGNIIQGQMSSPGVSAGAYPSSPSGQSYNFGGLFGAQSSGGFNPGNTNIPSNIGFTPSPVSLTSGSGFPQMNAASTWAQNNPLPAGVQDLSVPSDLGVTPPSTGTDLNALGNKILPYAQAAGQVIGGLQGLRAERRAIKEARKWAKVTGVQAKAAESEDIDRPRQLAENMRRRREAFMPVTTGEEFFPIYGVGTNVLAKNGARLQQGGMIGGNPTEIQNTYAPEYTLYDNLGYEPLDDSNQVKQFAYGGNLLQAQYGAAASGGTPWGAIGGIGSQLGSALTGNNAGGQVGSGIGTAAGMAIGGPIGGAIGGALGSVVGGLFGQKNQRRLRRAQNEIKGNVNRITASQFSDAMQGQFGGYMEDGGQLTNPQVITKFGEYSLKDLLAPDPTMDTLRSGGHLSGNYVPPSASGLSTMEEGGELQTYWGGYAEPMSYNPYLPDGGETVMFRGNSHDEYDGQGNTGIGVSFGNTNEPNVEVERGEPAVKLRDGGTGDENLVVYGNLKIPNYGVDILGDKNAKGKKFKNYVADLSKTEQKQNKLVEKSVNQLDALDIRNPFDRLKFASLQANITGGNMKLKEIAEKKIKAADLQNAINDTAEEYGLVADDLARGKVKFDKQATQEYAKYGKTLKKAREGVTTRESDPKKVKKVKALKTVPPGQGKNKYNLFGNVTPEMYEQMKQRNPWYDWEDFDPTNESDVADFQAQFNNLAESVGSRTRLQVDGDFGEQTVSADSSGFMKRERTPEFTTPEVKAQAKKDDEKEEDNQFEIVKYKQNPWLTALGQVLPFIRPTDQEPLDPRQLMGELYAMSTNKLEPVQAQPYSPQLRVPYDISLQDQLNEITADQRATQRMLGYNPAAQANLAAQTYGAKSKVLADQFRANQAMKDQVYAGNVAALNDAQLRNLDIYDRQYVRQAQAKSNTKAIAQAALNSISDKYAKNALENRTLGIYENLYNYRYDPAGRAINMNAPFQPVIPQMYNPGNDPNYVLVKDKDGNFTYVKRKKISPKEEAVATSDEDNLTPIQEYSPGNYNPLDINNDEIPDTLQALKKGGNLKKKKNYSQSSIVRMFK